MTLFGLGRAARGHRVRCVLGLSLDWLSFDLRRARAARRRRARLRRGRPPVAAGHRPRDPAAAGAEGLAGDRLPDLRQPRPAHGAASRSPPSRSARSGCARSSRSCAAASAARAPTGCPPRSAASSTSTPVEVTRRDAFELFRLSRKHARDRAHLGLPAGARLPHACPTGQTRHLEGPSSDTSPQGNITFHRLREYVAGDDLRLVHWRSSARAGRLLVKHNVDTSQPYTVVIFDQRPSLYTEESFEAGGRRRRVGARRERR